MPYSETKIVSGNRRFKTSRAREGTVKMCVNSSGRRICTGAEARQPGWNDEKNLVANGMVFPIYRRNATFLAPGKPDLPVNAYRKSHSRNRTKLASEEPSA